MASTDPPVVDSLTRTKKNIMCCTIIFTFPIGFIIFDIIRSGPERVKYEEIDFRFIKIMIIVIAVIIFMVLGVHCLAFVFTNFQSNDSENRFRISQPQPFSTTTTTSTNTVQSRRPIDIVMASPGNNIQSLAQYTCNVNRSLCYPPSLSSYNFSQFTSPPSYTVASLHSSVPLTVVRYNPSYDLPPSYEEAVRDTNHQ